MNGRECSAGRSRGDVAVLLSWMTVFWTPLMLSISQEKVAWHYDSTFLSWQLSLTILYFYLTPACQCTPVYTWSLVSPFPWHKQTFPNEMWQQRHNMRTIRGIKDQPNEDMKRFVYFFSSSIDLIHAIDLITMLLVTIYGSITWAAKPTSQAQVGSIMEALYCLTVMWGGGLSSTRSVSGRSELDHDPTHPQLL